MTDSVTRHANMSEGAAADAVPGVLGRAQLRPARPGGGEAILWEGRPNSGLLRVMEAIVFLLGLGILSWLAVSLVAPHFGGSAFAGQPTSGSLPLILAMLFGMMLIIAIPVWLRSSARGRARYMLTNRRALIWLGDKIVGEAVLFGSEVALVEDTVEFRARGVWLDWRLRDQGPDYVRFERIADAKTVIRLAEEHGARPIA